MKIQLAIKITHLKDNFILMGGRLSEVAENCSFSQELEIQFHTFLRERSCVILT